MDGTQEVINTDIDFLSEDKDFTILVDLEQNYDLGTGIFKVFSCMNGVSPWNGIVIQRTNASASQYQIQWMTKKQMYAVDTLSEGRVRVVLTHIKDSGIMSIKFKYNNDAIQTNNLSESCSTVSNNLIIGANMSNKEKFKGTISRFEIYNEVLTTEEISAFMS